MKKAVFGCGLAGILALVGCQSGMYQIDPGKCTDVKDATFAYRIVDRLDPESYSEDYLPVEVSVTKSSGTSSSAVFCFLTLGIIPAFYDDFETINVTVKTPIGTKSGSGVVHAKKWIGWICLIPYPGVAEERADNPKLPNSVLEEGVKDQIVKTLIAQFSETEYASFVRKINEAKAREQQRVLQEQQRMQQKRQALESLIKEGKFEEVIKACEDEKGEFGFGKENPWREISERAFVLLRESIPSMDDSSRLVLLFSMFNDSASKDAIIIRLGSLGKCSKLGDVKLVKYVAESSSEAGRMCAIAAITGEAELIAIARAKYSEALTVAAFKKLGKPDNIRDVVWKHANDLQLIKAYVDVFGNDEELALIVNQFGQHINLKAISLIRSKTTLQSVAKAINRIEAERMAEEIVEEVDINDFGVLLTRLNTIKDRSVLERVAAVVLKKHMQNNYNRIYLGQASSETMTAFAKCLPESVCERLFDSLDRNYFWGDKGDEMYCFLLDLLRKMSKDAFQHRLQAAMHRFSSGEKISFEGFYCGMTLQDYNVICASRDIYPSVSLRGNVVTRLVVGRTIRYKLFEKEDGEFWSAYLRKYVPSQKKKKSLSETIGDALDNGTFDYQEGWDDNLKERCYIYKSMKYGTRVLFGQKTGTLVMEEYK